MNNYPTVTFGIGQRSGLNTVIIVALLGVTCSHQPPSCGRPRHTQIAHPRATNILHERARPEATEESDVLSRRGWALLPEFLPDG